ncbi:hypothetical protein NG798_20795 [Ancylothrix sp. C2]|uniref:hypothetical protein n=1 Tax=Ancylothrix sp. D3o TaxID=2953691 RepID=UPI0021BA8873|nr:hypothetical protein [Ancylothrix sp. D3o]MCT7952240.1 hypothetical protein [Ancylothrix sp. D3o]
MIQQYGHSTPIPENQIDPAIARDSELTWERITNKPATYPSATHDHYTSQWTNPVYNTGWSAGSNPLSLRRSNTGVFICGAAKITFQAGMGQFLPIFTLPNSWRPSGIRYAPIIMNYPNTVNNSFAQFFSTGECYTFLPTLTSVPEISAWFEIFLAL